MELIQVKIIGMISLALGTLLVGLPSLWFSRRTRQHRSFCISFLLCFSGGVLLAISLVHILPEMRVSLQKYHQYAEIIFCVGFFTFYVLDELVHICYEQRSQLNNKQSKIGINLTAIEDPSVTQVPTAYGSTESNNYGFRSEKQPSYNPQFATNMNETIMNTDAAPLQQDSENVSISPMRNIGLLVALTIHSVVEGLAVGLETSVAKVLLLLGAIASHKFIVGFCLGVELSSAYSNTSFCHGFIYMLLFAFGSAVGIIIGTIVSSVSLDSSRLIIGILQGFAGGSLLYATVSEVLPKERILWHHNKGIKLAGIYQLTAVLIGFSVITLLIAYMHFD